VKILSCIIIALILCSCSQKRKILSEIQKSSLVVSAEEFIPADYEKIKILLNPKEFTKEDYVGCANKIKDSKREFFKIIYKTGDIKIESYLILPLDFSFNKKYPLIVASRGGNRDYGNYDVCSIQFTTSLFRLIPDAIIYFSEIRGTSGSDGEDEFGGADIFDNQTAYQMLSGISFIDQKNKFLFGWSRGTMTNFLALKKGLKFNATIAVGSVPNLIKNIEFAPGMKRVYEDLIPKYKSNPVESLKERSAIYWVEQINSPLLLVHGDKDERADIESVRILDQKMIELNLPHKLVVYAGGNHGLTHQIDKLKIEIRDWFLKYRIK
jgi:dipeptidyl aminopeptidase/acylaminoacyl peptidase